MDRRTPLAATAVAAAAIYLTWRGATVPANPAAWALLALEAAAFARLGALWWARTGTHTLEVLSCTTTLDTLVVTATELTSDEDLTRSIVTAAGVARRVVVIDGANHTRTTRRHHVERIVAGGRTHWEVLADATDRLDGIVGWVHAGDVADAALGDLVELCDGRVAVAQGAVGLLGDDSLAHLDGSDDTLVEQQCRSPWLARRGAGEWTGSGSVVDVGAAAAAGVFAYVDGPGPASVRLAATGQRVAVTGTTTARRVAARDAIGYLEHVRARSAASLATAAAAVRTAGLGPGARAGYVAGGLRSVESVARLAAVCVAGSAVVAGWALASWTATLAIGVAAAVRALLWQAGTSRLCGIGADTRAAWRRSSADLAAVAGRSTPRRAFAAPAVTVATVAVATTVVAAGGFDAATGTLTITAALLAAAAVSLAAAGSHRQRRADWRAEVALDATVDGQVCRTANLTPRGAGFHVADPIAVGRRVAVHVDIDGYPLAATALVAHCTRTSGAHWTVGVSFDTLRDTDTDTLIAHCARRRSQRTPAPQLTELSGAGNTARRGAVAAAAIAVCAAGFAVAAAPADANTGRVAAVQLVAHHDEHRVTLEVRNTTTGRAGPVTVTVDGVRVAHLDGIAAAASRTVDLDADTAGEVCAQDRHGATCVRIARR